MITRKLFLFLLLVVVSSQRPASSRQEPSSQTDNNINQYQLSNQLNINRDTLLQGPTEKIRIDAASVMLADDDVQTRKVLLDILQHSDNLQARLAICKAISIYRIAGDDLIKNKKDFIIPLIDLLTKANGELATQASEAILIFDYKQIANQLEARSADKSLSLGARLNVIYAMKLQPDIRAIDRLLDMVDDSNDNVAFAASETLKALSIPIGTSPKDRKLIKKTLEQKGKDGFLLDRIKRLDDQKRMLETERALWRQKYIQASERIYKSINDDQARGKFLNDEYLTSQDDQLKLWALSKIEEWLKGTNPQVPACIGQQLIKFISDGNRDIRSKTANILPFMGDLNSAKPLVDQIKLETDDNIRLELFAALGFACRNAKTTISPEIRKQTLDWSVDYLFSKDIDRVKKGADVIKKLLEQNGLSNIDTETYLATIEKRFSQEMQIPENAELRAYLLNIMSGLCSHQIYHDQAASHYKSFFEQALNDDLDKIREAAVDGLVFVDEKRAIQTLRTRFVNDTSPVIRKRLIDLAGKVGSEEDLQWLIEKKAIATQSDAAWAAILKILGDSSTETLSKWIETFEKAPQGSIGDQQLITLLDMAEKKADAEKNNDILNLVRSKLSILYSKTGDYEKAATYLGTLIKTSDGLQRDKLTGDLVNIYLRWSNIDAVGNLVSNQLLNSDIKPDSCMVVTIENYLAEPNSNSDPNLVIAALSKVTADIKDRPLWHNQLTQWKKSLKKPKTDKP